MMEFSVKVDVTEAMKQLRGIKDNQLPFAFAHALTMTAKDVQEEMIKELPDRFTLRTKWYMPQTPWGFKIEVAKKTNFVSSIYTKAPWMGIQETGGIQTPRGVMLAIPSKNVKPTIQTLIPKRLKPKQLLHQGKIKGFFAQMRNGHYGIFQRVGRARLPIRLMYSLYSSVTIKERLKFYATAQNVVKSKFTINMIKAFEEALKTAK